MSDTELTPMQRAFTRKGLFWIILIAGLVADIATKAWADSTIRPTGIAPHPVIEGVFSWKWAENEGAAFSIMEGRPYLLAAIASCVLIAVLVYAIKAEPKRRWFLAALALVAAGAIGNLYDRLLLGHVRDFLYFDFDLPWHGAKILWLEIPRRYPVFNVADIEIIAGVLILMAMSFKPEKKKSKSKDKAAESEEPLTTGAADAA